MEGWLKALIAAACVVVVAGGGYFGWKEYRTAQVQAAAQAQADKVAAERLRLERITPEACIRMAQETLPEKIGDPPKTSVYLKALNECDDLGRLDSGWRHQLDRSGIF